MDVIITTGTEDVNSGAKRWDGNDDSNEDDHKIGEVEIPLPDQINLLLTDKTTIHKG